MFPDESKGIIHVVAGGVYYKVNMADGEIVYVWNMANMKAIYSVMDCNEKMVSL